MICCGWWWAIVVVIVSLLHVYSSLLSLPLLSLSLSLPLWLESLPLFAGHQKT